MPKERTPNDTASESELSSPPRSPKREERAAESEMKEERSEKHSEEKQDDLVPDQLASTNKLEEEKDTEHTAAESAHDNDRPPISPQPVPSPQDKKLHALHTSNAALQAQISALKTELETLQEGLINKNADQTVNRHIRLLHDYNELRDVGLGLMGLLAENRGVRVKDVLEEMGVDDD